MRRKHAGPRTWKALCNCTKEEFVDEVLAQTYESEALNLMIKQANDGQSFCFFRRRTLYPTITTYS